MSTGATLDATNPAWWGFHGAGDPGRSVLGLIADGTLDAELAALLWLLLEARLPVVVAAGPPLAGKTTVLTALLDFLPPGTRRVYLRGAWEDYTWLAEASALGWRSGDAPSPEAARPWAAGPLTASDGATTDAGALAGAAADGGKEDVRRRETYLLAAELSAHLPVYTWGMAARTAVRAIALGYGLGTTMHAESLEDVFDSLRGPDVRLTDDELSRLGLVLVLRALRGPTGVQRRRVVAAHYVRPLMRDAGGHVQRLAPAVLATWDGRTDSFEHFAWGVVPELAGRVGLRPGDFELEQRRRADYVAGLVAAGLLSNAEARSAIAGYRAADRPDVSVPAASDAADSSDPAGTHGPA